MPQWLRTLAFWGFAVTLGMGIRAYFDSPKTEPRLSTQSTSAPSNDKTKTRKFAQNKNQHELKKALPELSAALSKVLAEEKPKLKGGESLTELGKLYQGAAPFDFEFKEKLLLNARQVSFKQHRELREFAIQAFQLTNPKDSELPLDDRHLDHLENIIRTLRAGAHIRGQLEQVSIELKAESIHPTVRRSIDSIFFPSEEELESLSKLN